MSGTPIPIRPIPADRARLVLAAACWGLGTVASKAAVAAFAPMPLLVIQLTASVALLASVLAIRGVAPTRLVPRTRLHWLGVLNPGLAYALSLLALPLVTASLAVLLWALEPVAILVLAAIVLGERLGRVGVAGSGAAIVGVGIVVAGPLGAVSPLGVGLTLAAVGCCAVYSVAARRWLDTGDGSLEIVGAQQVAALATVAVAVGGIAIVAPGAYVDASVTERPVADVVAWLAAIGSGILYYAAAYWLYLGALRRIPASQAASAFYLIPVFGVTGGVLLLGERLDLLAWAGAAIVVLGVAVVLRQESHAG